MSIVQSGTLAEGPKGRPKPQLARALAYIRGEGWTVRKLGFGLWRVRQLGDERDMSRPELLAFAGLSEPAPSPMETNP